MLGAPSPLWLQSIMTACLGLKGGKPFSPQVQGTVSPAVGHWMWVRCGSFLSHKPTTRTWPELKGCQGQGICFSTSHWTSSASQMRACVCAPLCYQEFSLTAWEQIIHMQWLVSVDIWDEYGWCSPTVFVVLSLFLFTNSGTKKSFAPLVSCALGKLQSGGLWGIGKNKHFAKPSLNSDLPQQDSIKGFSNYICLCPSVSFPFTVSQSFSTIL